MQQTDRRLPTANSVHYLRISLETNNIVVLFKFGTCLSARKLKLKSVSQKIR